MHPCVQLEGDRRHPGSHGAGWTLPTGRCARCAGLQAPRWQDLPLGALPPASHAAQPMRLPSHLAPPASAGMHCTAKATQAATASLTHPARLVPVLPCSAGSADGGGGPPSHDAPLGPGLAPGGCRTGTAGRALHSLPFNLPFNCPSTAPQLPFNLPCNLPCGLPRCWRNFGGPAHFPLRPPYSFYSWHR